MFLLLLFFPENCKPKCGTLDHHGATLNFQGQQDSNTEARWAYRRR